ncbi:hypothetical protein NQ317_016502 [Molorchus minor]|uniref:Uncharacterized protein n=1 Tax=Molorchus minor TaxID=1323400 RepID=A0ABQ9JT71_9CUCU|nr:hypothetical protein NQ317_016502 [Molorchus minor]
MYILNGDLGIFTNELTPSLEILQLDNNEIYNIEDSSFSNLTKFKKIDLEQNRLEFWRPEWFENTLSLEFPKLKEIWFNYNEITMIQEDAFKEVRYLEYLGVAHNRLTKIEAISFPNTLRISTLFINANYLNYMTDKVLQKLAAVKIVMDYNPWKCECLDHVCKETIYRTVLFLKNSTGTCTDTVDDELTQRYIGLLRNLSNPVDLTCAQLE